MESLVSAMDDIQNEDECTKTDADKYSAQNKIQTDIDQYSFMDDRRDDHNSLALTYEPPTQSHTNFNWFQCPFDAIEKSVQGTSTNEIGLIPGTTLKSSE